MHHPQGELGRFAVGLPPGAALAADAFISQRAMSVHPQTSYLFGATGTNVLEAQVFARHLLNASAVSATFTPSPSDAHWEPVSNMDAASPALVFDASTGDVVMGWIS